MISPYVIINPVTFGFMVFAGARMLAMCACLHVLHVCRQCVQVCMYIVNVCMSACTVHMYVPYQCHAKYSCRQCLYMYVCMYICTYSMCVFDVCICMEYTHTQNVFDVCVCTYVSKLVGTSKRPTGHISHGSLRFPDVTID